MATRHGAWLAKCSATLARLICTLTCLSRTHFHGVHLEHVLGDVQTDYLQAVHGADGLFLIDGCTIAVPQLFSD
jgi:hypothetical protein